MSGQQVRLNWKQQQQHQVQKLQLKLKFSLTPPPRIMYESHKSQQQLTLHINHQFLLIPFHLISHSAHNGTTELQFIGKSY
jgi:hypothetical protein